MSEENEALDASKTYQSKVEDSIDYIERFDILETINNVGNDEVFTPVRTCQMILDILPDEVWHDPDYKWLNPCDKNGVFLREIAIRLDKGLKDVPGYENDEFRRKHIMTEMLYSIGLTKFTALVSRRTNYYCSSANRKPDGDMDKDGHCKNGYAIGYGEWFDTGQGNILSPISEHEFVKGKCKFCGTAEGGRYTDPTQNEHYAYEFVHVNHLELERHLQNRFFKGDRSMKFDIIIGNPPYQLNFGLTGGNSSNSGAIYHQFISQAISLNPKYICMITPSRWMTKTAQGITDEWVEEMLNCNKFRVIHDYPDANECFPKSDSNISLKGGCSYFLWDRDYNGPCDYNYHSIDGQVIKRVGQLNSLGTGILIRDPRCFSVIEKIEKVEGKYYLNPNDNFSGYVSPKHFFDNSILLTSNWNDYKTEKDDVHNIKYYISKNFKGIPYGWISKDQIPKKIEVKDLHKVLIPASGGSGSDPYVLGRPIYSEPNSICSQTYLVIGYDPKIHNFTKEQCLNIISYIKTKLFRYLVSIVKTTQSGPRGVYTFVPKQDFSKPWTDKELYEKYHLTDEEIKTIEERIGDLD